MARLHVQRRAACSGVRGLGKGVWFLGVLSAGFTSFYMWRLVFMTFFSGRLRASHDVAHHVHESPPTMTIPLIALATLAVFGGALAWPHVLGGHEWLVEWLSPAVGAAPEYEGEHLGLEIGLMVFSTAVALVGFLRPTGSTPARFIR